MPWTCFICSTPSHFAAPAAPVIILCLMASQPPGPGCAGWSSFALLCPRKLNNINCGQCAPYISSCLLGLARGRQLRKIKVVLTKLILPSVLLPSIVSRHTPDLNFTWLASLIHRGPTKLSFQKGLLSGSCRSPF